MLMMGNANVGHGGRQSGAAYSGLSQEEPGSINLLNAISTLETAFHKATDENERLKAHLGELGAEIVEWREKFTKVEPYIENLEKQLHSKNQEIQRLTPYGSYCISGANPYFLQNSLQRVSHALHGFVLSIRIATGKPSSDIAGLSMDEALVSSIFFSKFERVDLGVEDVATFIPPPQLPELSFQEYKAFDAFMEDQEDCRNKAAVEPYWRKFNAFYEMVAKDMSNLFLLGQIEVNDERRARFWNLTLNVWMLHKLSLSFDKANVRIMRVGRGEEFNREFMMTVPGRQDEEEHKLGTPSLVVQHLILPGIWINGSIFKCSVFLGSPVHQEIDCTLGAGNQVGVMNGTDQPQNMDNGVETLASIERPAIGTSSHRTFLLSPIMSTLVCMRPNFLWKAIILYFRSLSRGQVCLEFRPHLRDQSSSEEPPELEPQRECNQHASLVSDSDNSPGSELHMAAEVSPPPCSEQAVNNDTQASSHGAGTAKPCENIEEVEVDGVQEKLEASSPQELLLTAAEHPNIVAGIGFIIET